MMKDCQSCKFNNQLPEFELKRCKKCSRTDRTLFEPIPGAADIMESIIDNGMYPSYSRAKKEDEGIKKAMENRLKHSEVRRHELKNTNLVAKFVPKKISKVDHQGLNEFLDDMGLLQFIATFDSAKIKKDTLLQQQLIAYQLEPTYFVKPNFNKAGNEKNAFSYVEDDSMSLEDLAQTLVQIKSRLDSYKSNYEKAKKQMILCPELLKKKKVSHKYGSVSLLENNPVYDIQAIYEELGSEFLIQYGKADSSLLAKYIEKGYFPKSAIEKFKTVIDIRLDFVVMDLDTERKNFEILHSKTMKAARNYVGA